MLFPSIFRDNIVDGFFGNPFGFDNVSVNAMKTDVKETKDGYQLLIDLPGVKKEDIHAELKDGYLTISATTAQNNDEQDSDGNYIRRERYTGSFSRSFYVGEDITETDIKAKFTDGVLNLEIPKKEPVPQVPEKKIIAIEG